jgi:cysteine protease ATG4
MVARDLLQGLPADRPVLLLAPVMLGVGKLAADHTGFVKKSLEIPQTVGIVGGTKKKSFWFVGYHAGDRELLYFDPHTVLAAVETDAHDVRLYRPGLKGISFEKVESSMLMGYCVKPGDELENVLTDLNQDGRCPIAIVDALPADSADEMHDDWEVVAVG